jgi:hypothetical protein
MRVPFIPRYLFKFGIKPQHQGTEKLFGETRHGLHLAGFDVETIGGQLFRKNDLFSVQIVMDKASNSHIFFPKHQGAKNLGLFFSICDSNTKRVFASAHNASFDVGALLGSDVYPLMRGEEVNGWKGKIVDGNTCFAILRHKGLGKSLTIADSMAWFRGSLKNVAEKHFGVGLQKLARPEFLGLRPPRTREEFDHFVDYAEQDAIIQLELTKKMHAFAQEGRVKTCLTPAQLAGRVFQKSYLKNRIFLPNPRLLPLIARSYHGAQFTAFGRGFFEKVYYYDINSLYPYAAINTPLNFSNAELEPMTLEDVERGFVGFVAAKFRFRDSEGYPNLPQYRIIRGFRKMVFPLEGYTYTTTEEVKAALKKDVEIIGWKGYGWFPTEEDINHPLAGFMQDIYDKKAELDEREDLMPEEMDLRQYYKLLLNSLIGKFCQRNRTWPGHKEIAGSLFMPDFASLILSKSRVVINDLISKHGAIYSDTDALMTHRKLETGTKIGQLKNELGKGKRGDLISIRSKLYFVTEDDKVLKCAKHGFRKSSQDVFRDLLDRRKKTFVQYSVNRMTKLKEAYRRHELPRRMINQTFKIMLKDDGKRQYDENLKTVNDLLTGRTMSRPLRGWA